ncbi:MAG: CTP synthase C-terminal region-related (seleno)protein [Actinoallomurus sp.]
MDTFTPRIALVGDRSPNVRAHARIPALLTALAVRDRLVLDAYWVPTDEPSTVLDGFDAIWLVPGSPYRSEAGALAAVRTARTRNIPFLGTCGGFQHALLEYARNVCGLASASHAENPSGDGDALIVPLACSLVGHSGAVRVTARSLAERALGAERSVERYHCSYGLSPAFLDVLRSGGLRFSGVDENGEVRIAELPGHPYFLATLFQPELAGDGTRAHPIIRAFAAAAVRHRSSPAKPGCADGPGSPTMEHELDTHG